MRSETHFQHCTGMPRCSANGNGDMIVETTLADRCTKQKEMYQIRDYDPSSG